jgi:hypothetical protein
VSPFPLRLTCLESVRTSADHLAADIRSFAWRLEASLVVVVDALSGSASTPLCGARAVAGRLGRTHGN